MDFEDVFNLNKKWRFHERPPYEIKWENDGGNYELMKECILYGGDLYTGKLATAWHRQLNHFTKINKRGITMLATNPTTEMQKTDLKQPTVSPEEAINTGISEKDRKSVADGLSHVLADTYSLYLKTQNFHWNVTGPKFVSLHLLFEQQYKQLAEAIDLIAERIRALGFMAPASFATFMKMSSLAQDELVQNADEMISLLIRGHETVVRDIQPVSRSADEVHDDSTLDLLSRRAEEHEKSAWMLRSLIQ